jgi:hypothetical protein
VRRSALVFLGIASPLLLVSLWLGAAAPFVVLAVAFPVGLMALGAARGGAGRRRPKLVAAVLIALLVILEVSFVAMLNLRGRLEEAAWPLGFPLASWILLVGVGLLPLLLIPAAYATLFRGQGLSAEDLARVREAGRRQARGGG